MEPDGAIVERYEALIQRRAMREPVAYIIGEKEFWSLSFRVTPDTLVPRADSEILVEAALSVSRAAALFDVLDLGVGSGCLLLSVLSERPGARGVGVDKSPAAAAVARDNAVRLGLGCRACFLVGDWAESIKARFDIILSNPPYIGTDEILPRDVADHEPANALYAGSDGLQAYRRIVADGPRLLKSGGWLVLEIGARQDKAVAELIRMQGGRDIRLKQDLAGRPRCLMARF